MKAVHEECDCDAPIGAVFDWLTTCGNYAAAPRMFSGRLVRPGREGGESLAALRAFRSSVSWWREEITGYEKPRMFRYQVVRTFPPVYRHHGATIELTEHEGRTHVTWVSTFSIPAPLIGAVLERVLFPIGQFYVRSILEAAAKAFVRTHA